MMSIYNEDLDYLWEGIESIDNLSKEDFKEIISKADTIISKAIENDPNNAEVFYSRGWAKYGLSDYHNAIDDFDKAIEINPDNADAFRGRGWAKYGLSDYHNAVVDFDKAIEIDPDNANAFRGRGWAKYELT